MAPLRLDCPFPRARKGPVDGPVDEVPVVQRSVVLLKKEGLCVCVWYLWGICVVSVGYLWDICGVTLHHDHL